MFDVRGGRRNLAIVALAIAFIFVFSMVIQTIVYGLAFLLAPRLIQNTMFLWITSGLSMYAVSMPLSTVIFSQCKVTCAPRHEKMDAWTFIGVFSLCFAGTYLLGVVGSAANEIFSSVLQKEAVNGLEEMVNSVPLWFNFLLTVILAPIFEEIFTRKLVIDRLLPLGEVPAVLLSGVAFGLIHGNFNQLFYAIGVGLVLGLVYTRTGRLRYTIAIHMLLNFFGSVYVGEANKLLEGGTFFGLLPQPLGEQVGAGLLLGYFAMLVITAIIAIVFCFGMREKMPEFDRPEPQPTSRDWVRMLIYNPGVLVFLAISVVMFFS